MIRSLYNSSILSKIDLDLLYLPPGKDWPAHVDGYCNVGRRRSWTWIKLGGARSGVLRKHSIRQRLSSARIPPDRRARRGDRSHGVSVASRALARISLQALRQRPSAGLPQDQAKTTLRKAQDSNPSHGPSRLSGLGPKPHRVRRTDRVATLVQASDSDGHSCRLSRGKAAVE